MHCPWHYSHWKIIKIKSEKEDYILLLGEREKEKKTTSGYLKANSQVKIQTLNSYIGLLPANLKGKDNVKISLLLSTRHHR